MGTITATAIHSPSMHFQQIYIVDIVYQATVKQFHKTSVAHVITALTSPGNNKMVFCLTNNKGLWTDRF